MVQALQSSGEKQQAKAPERGTLLSELTTLYLRHLPISGPLRERAVAQMIAKVLFTAPDGAMTTTDEIRETLRLWVGVEIAKSDFDGALSYLRSTQRWIVGTQDGWRLTGDARRRVAEEVRAHGTRVERILSRFPSRLPKEQLLRWFKTTTARFFERYGSQTAAAIFRQASPVGSAETLREIVERCAESCGLTEYVDDLLDGFRAYIERPTIEEQSDIWCRWEAAFGARLIKANLGSDPITVDQLSQSRVFCDTNVLVTIALEARESNARIAALPKALEYMELRLVVLPTTVAEYKALVGAKRKEVLAVMRRAPTGALRRSSDVFVRTAVLRGCIEPEDFAQFFDSISEPPQTLAESIPIVVADKPEYHESGRRGEVDGALIRDILRSTSHKSRTKNQSAAEHDAALLTVVEDARRRGESCWVLTEDLAMASLSLRRAAKNEVPAWIGLPALVQILAVDAGGPEVRPEEFGGLLSAIFEHDLQPDLGTYEPEDLDIALEIDGRFANMPAEAIISAASVIFRERLRGKDRDDKRLQLEVARVLHREKRPLVQKLAEITVQASNTSRDLQEEQKKRRRLEAGLLAERKQALTRRAKFGFVRWLLLLVPLALVAAFAAVVFAATAGSDENVRLLAASVASTISVTCFGEIWRRGFQLRNSLRVVPTDAAEEVKAMLRG